jgi:hypothetical protein
MDKAIAHFITTKLLLALWLFVTLPVWLPITWLVKSIATSGDVGVLLAWVIRVTLADMLLRIILAFQEDVSSHDNRRS